jgi:type II secretory pathway component PulC
MLNSLSRAKAGASLKAYVQRSMSGSPGQKVLLLSNLLLALVMAVLLVAMVMLLINDKPAAKEISRAPAGAVTSLRWTWFNSTAAAAPIEEQVDLNDLADANVKAKLLGVVLSERTSSATIAFNGRPERVYHIGDKLGSAIVIKQIQPFRIIVEQNGAKRQIQLEKADSLIKTEQSLSSDETKGSGKKAADEGFAMANMFGALPVRAGKYGRGFKLNKLSNEMKGLADIEEGDVIVDIGGTDVQSLMANPAEWIKYSRQSSLPVKVLRNGEEVIVNVNAASLSAKMLPKLGLSN